MQLKEIIDKNVFDLKVEFLMLTDTIAGEKPFVYNDELSKGENIYLASMLGAIIAYETLSNYLTSTNGKPGASNDTNRIL